MRGEHASEACERFVLGTSETRVVVRAPPLDVLQELERVAVENQVGRAAPLRIDDLQERREVLRPPEVFPGIPRSRRVAPDAHVQVAQHDGEAARRRGRRLLHPRRSGRLGDQRQRQ